MQTRSGHSSAVMLLYCLRQDDTCCRGECVQQRRRVLSREHIHTRPSGPCCQILTDIKTLQVQGHLSCIQWCNDLSPCCRMLWQAHARDCTFSLWDLDTRRWHNAVQEFTLHFKSVLPPLRLSLRQAHCAFSRRQAGVQTRCPTLGPERLHTKNATDHAHASML